MNFVPQFSIQQAKAVFVAFALVPFTASVQAQSGLPNFADLVERNAPTIVEISTVRRVEARTSVADEEMQDLLRRLNPDGGTPNFDLDELPEPQPRGAVGSGFLISADGYVLTNNHVVEGADEIEVQLNDRRVYKAEVIGLDEPSDLALLKLDAQDLPYVEFGNSDALRGKSVV